MKKIYFLTVTILLLHTAQAQYTAIPDQNFEQALIDLGYDNVIDGKVITANIESITVLDVYVRGIQDLTGIQDFAALISLNASNNQLSSLNLSQNTNLENLNIGYNPISTIDVSNNIGLKSLNISSSNFITLDITNNIKLETLVIRFNPIATIDISNNPNLEGLYATSTNLTGLFTSQNPHLSFLDLSFNNISSLDLTNNTELIHLTLDENNLTQLDLSNNPNLELLYCSFNFNLSFINLKNGKSQSLENFSANYIAANACIQVDDAQAAINATTYPYNLWYVDSSSTYAEDCSLSINSFASKKLQFFPNPAIDHITFLNSSIISYEIYDAKGSSVIANTKFTGNTIDVASLNPGIYFIKVYNDIIQSQTIRFIKK